MITAPPGRRDQPARSRPVFEATHKHLCPRAELRLGDGCHGSHGSHGGAGSIAVISNLRSAGGSVAIPAPPADFDNLTGWSSGRNVPQDRLEHSDRITRSKRVPVIGSGDEPKRSPNCGEHVGPT